MYIFKMNQSVTVGYRELVDEQPVPGARAPVQSVLGLGLVFCFDLVMTLDLDCTLYRLRCLLMFSFLPSVMMVLTMH